ncbi:MAG: malonyl-CoA decarboxylase domain-containing protein, partial [Hyphomicrobiaceae bacterium]
DKIIAYEAVHEISGWEDLRRRLEPSDRRCFAFFHPSLVDEPLIFVEVALMDAIPTNIGSVLKREVTDAEADKDHTTAVFYSISNCQKGLRGVSFGNFLIKQVVEELTRECPGLKTFVTLSPVPGFARWLEKVLSDERDSALDDRQHDAVVALKGGGWLDDESLRTSMAPHLQTLAATYFLTERNSRGHPIDPVARFHLGNGARLERLNWPADLSPRGMREAHGLMVNYLYELSEIEKNHEAYANAATIATSRAVRSLIRGRGFSRETASAVEEVPSALSAGSDSGAENHGRRADDEHNNASNQVVHDVSEESELVSNNVSNDREVDGAMAKLEP